MLEQGYANVSLRIDRVVGTVDRIECRLGPGVTPDELQRP